MFVLDVLEDVFARLRGFRQQGGITATAGSAIVAHLRRAGAVDVLREDGYVDRDYSAAFENFYGRFYRPPAKFTTRYHFFSTPASSFEALPPAADYLGFVVVWPTDPPVIGRTLLVPPDGWNSLGIASVAHIGRVRYEFQAVPYATKDFGVSACATIATWLATEVAGPAFGLPRTSSYEVTRLAGVDGQGHGMLPQRFGLDPGQIAMALARLGFHPFVYDLENFRWRAPGTVYGALISGIPVILMVEFFTEGAPSSTGGGLPPDIAASEERERHAILAVGFRHELRTAEAAGGWAGGMTRLLIHDDRYGPYLAATPEPGVGEGVVKLAVEYPGGPREVMVKQMIVPLPPKTYTISTDAHIAGGKLLGQKFQAEDVAFRTYLTSSRELKAATPGWKHARVGLSLSGTPLPQRVWVTEAWSRPLDSRDSGVRARVVMDATVLRDSSISRYLWAHIEDEALNLNAWEALSAEQLEEQVEIIQSEILHKPPTPG